jgi:uncharacterized membrane protein YeiH
MLLINLFEIMGTVAFAISGSLIGIEKGLDLFGIIFLAITTSIGGGIFRDIIIGQTPPAAFVNPEAAIISIVTAIIVFLFHEKIIKLKNIIIISDALGLGVFTAMGSRAAVMHGEKGAFVVITMGLLTGVGGGMLRDVFVKDIPFVFRKEIYAIASIAGAVVFYVMNTHIPEIMLLYVCCSITSFIRILSVLFNFNLPVHKTIFDNSNTNIETSS